MTFVDTPAGFGNRVAVDRAFRSAGAARRVATEVADLPGIPRFVQSGLGPAVVPRAGIAPLEGVTAIDLEWPGLGGSCPCARGRAPRRRSRRSSHSSRSG
ncbi:LysR substrate-binding domain-containing protein [Rathayibacter oskolensis]|nr:LysR substrate-binding domain-containing protein [Rathayibacter oskolensis]WKK73245.1 LysR substrate-binding domain-containing protein [Rathayibacter oskolensis]